MNEKILKLEFLGKGGYLHRRNKDRQMCDTTY